MEEELKTPTIENPFAKEKPTIANPFKDKNKDRKDRRTFIQARTRPATDPYAPPKVYRPKFYVSQASQRYVAFEVEKKNLTEDEVPFLYDLAFVIGKVFNRPTPTVSDVETAVKLRTLDNAKKIADGEIELDIIRNEIRTMEVMPKKERILFWRTVAGRVLEEYEKIFNPKPVVEAPPTET